MRKPVPRERCVRGLALRPLPSNCSKNAQIPGEARGTFREGIPPRCMTFFSVLILTTALPADWTSGTKSGTTGAACAEKTNDMTSMTATSGSICICATCEKLLYTIRWGQSRSNCFLHNSHRQKVVNTLIWYKLFTFWLIGAVSASLIAEPCKMKNLLKMKNLYCCRVGVISLLRYGEERRF